MSMMSCGYRQFTVQLSLQHISMVKIGQQLWKQADIIDQIKKLFHEIECDSGGPWDFLECAFKSVTNYAIAKINELVLPEVMRSDVGYCVTGMGRTMFRWLRDTLRDMIDNRDNNCMAKISYFIENVSWNGFGCVDGEKIFRKYVGNRGAVDNATWSQLCGYCIEDYIKKYSGSIDWNNYRDINSTFTVFWYHEIHGKFPTEGMFSSVVKRMKFVFEYNKGRYDENSIIGTLLVESVIEGNISAVKYFWKRLSDDEKHQLILTRLGSIFIQCDKDYSEVYIYLLGEMCDEQLKFFFEKNFRIPEVMILNDWPWILCINSWGHFFEFCRGTPLFWRILVSTFKKMKCEIKEFQARKYKGVLYNKYRQFFEELWEMRPEGLHREDIKLCGIIFDEGNETRKIHSRKLKDLNDDYLKEFMDEIMADDEEDILEENIRL